MQRKKRQTRKACYKVIMWVSGSILLLILFVFAWRTSVYRKAQTEYEAVAVLEVIETQQEETDVAEPVSEAELFEPDVRLMEQQKVNEDIIGWIAIPDTNVNYPIVQTDNNDYYTNHTFLRTENPAGAIFMETQNQGDFSDLVTFVYGHRMKDGSMFGDLKYYGDKAYWEKHPEIHISTFQDNRVYEIFSVHRADTSTDTFRLFFKAGEEYGTYLQSEKSLSYYDTEIDVGMDDKILVLVTCTADVKSERIVVLGKLKQDVREN